MADGPKMPTLSKMLPMVVMMALNEFNEFDLEELGLRSHYEAAFFGVQLGSFSCTV